MQKGGSHLQCLIPESKHYCLCVTSCGRDYSHPRQARTGRKAGKERGISLGGVWYRWKEECSSGWNTGGVRWQDLDGVRSRWGCSRGTRTEGSAGWSWCHFQTLNSSWSILSFQLSEAGGMRLTRTRFWCSGLEIGVTQDASELGWIVEHQGSLILQELVVALIWDIRGFLLLGWVPGFPRCHFLSAPWRACCHCEGISSPFS